MPGKLKLDSLRPSDRSVVVQGMRARAEGKSKSTNPYTPKTRRNRTELSAKGVWWDLGWEGAYE